MVWWTVGGVGDWARVTNDGIEAHGQVLHGGGSLTLEDVDGNGTEDLLASWDGGRLAVYRTTDGAIGQGWIGHTRSTAVGPAFAADGSGEGDVDLLFLDDSGTILLTPPPGTPPASGQ